MSDWKMPANAKPKRTTVVVGAAGAGGGGGGGDVRYSRGQRRLRLRISWAVVKAGRRLSELGYRLAR